MSGLGPLISAHRARAERALAALFDDDTVAGADTRLREAMRYSLLAGGKRLRPVLLFAACEAIGADTPAVADVDRVACALECIHTYSLIHDDLPAMDDDDLRRGVPTCHRAFDEATAILAGDALLTLAFELLAAAQGIAPDVRIRLVAELARASGSHGMVGGQAIDMAHVGREIDAATLERMHQLKTGALIAVALRMGALLGGADAAALRALDAYANAVGLAFQVQDDILDASGTAEQLGKRPGADARASKPTYVSLLGMDEARRQAGALCAQAVDALAGFGPRAEPLRELARYIIGRDR